MNFSKTVPTSPFRQRGVALITVLLVVALATAMAVGMISRQQITLRRTANLLHHEQAYLYVLGAEQWAGQILARDQKNRDSLEDEWATRLPPTLVEGGSLGGYLEDLQGRFNLNGLLNADGQPNELHLSRFQRLLQVLELPTRLAAEAMDWMDPDGNPRVPDGAEAYAYLGRKPAYRNADMVFHSVTELRLLFSMKAEYYQRLAPHVCALPERRANINLNTATLPVLQALHPELDLFRAEQLQAEQKAGGFPSLDDFLQHPALSGLALNRQGLGLSSRYFLFHGEADIGQARAGLVSLLRRDNDGVQVLTRGLF